MLDIRNACRDRAERDRIERPAPCGEHQNRGGSRGNLEPTRRDVVMGDPVADDVDERPERDRRDPPPNQCADSRARSDVDRHDHRAVS